jgi:hypothetical protein
MNKAMLSTVALLMCMIAFNAHAFEEWNDTDEPSDCLADWDPFCPQGSPGSGGGGDYPSPCYYCEMTTTGGKCSQVPEGSTGKTDCSNVYEGTDPVWCETSGNTFCENISVTP